MFQQEKAAQVDILVKKMSEYSNLKKEILIKLWDTLSLIGTDMDTPGISSEEIMRIRDMILDISEKIVETSEKFSFIQRIYLGDFLNYNEIKKALYDFSNTEVGLFIQIRWELYSIIEGWVVFHTSELKVLESEISEQSINGTTDMNVVLQLQAKRLESYIEEMQILFK
jgi:hypothetical protein